MNNSDGRVAYLNELAEEYEHDPDADGIEVRPLRFFDLLEAVRGADYATSCELLVTAYKLGLDDGTAMVDDVLQRTAVGGAK